MSEKLRKVILTCFLVVICQTLTCCEIVKEDAEQRMVNSFVLGIDEHYVNTMDAFFPFIVPKADQKFPPQEFETNSSDEFHFLNLYIEDEVRNFYYNTKNIVIEKDAFDKKTLDIEKLYDISKYLFELIFTSKDLAHPIYYISNKNLITLYFECGKNILDSSEKLYDYSRTGSSKDKKNFLKTSEKLEDKLLILYQGMLGEHGLDSDILQAVKTHKQDYRETFVGEVGFYLSYLNLASIVLAYSYNLNDSRSLSDWSKTMIPLLEKEIQLKRIVLLTSIEWTNQEHVKEKLIEFVKNQKNIENRVLADILNEHLTSKYHTEHWLVIVYDDLDEIDEGGQMSLVGIHHHVFQVDGKIVLAFHQSKLMTTVRRMVNFKYQNKPFNPFDKISSHIADGNFKLKPHDFLGLLRTDNLNDEYSIIVLPPKTNCHYYKSDQCPDFQIVQSLLKANLYSLFFVKSYSLPSEPKNTFETPKTRSRSEL